MAEPTLDGKRQEERDTGDCTSSDEEWFQDVCTHVGDVGDAPIFGRVMWSALGFPRDEHCEERACVLQSELVSKTRRADRVPVDKRAHQTTQLRLSEVSKHTPSAGALAA